LVQLQTSPPQALFGQSVSLKQGVGAWLGVGVIVVLPATPVAVPALAWLPA
jgi:hypothetical protein